jgi:hypothetical protein
MPPLFSMHIHLISALMRCTDLLVLVTGMVGNGGVTCLIWLWSSTRGIQNGYALCFQPSLDSILPLQAWCLWDCRLSSGTWYSKGKDFWEWFLVWKCKWKNLYNVVSFFQFPGSLQCRLSLLKSGFIRCCVFWPIADMINHYPAIVTKSQMIRIKTTMTMSFLSILVRERWHKWLRFDELWTSLFKQTSVIELQWIMWWLTSDTMHVVCAGPLPFEEEWRSYSSGTPE